MRRVFRAKELPVACLLTLGTVLFAPNNPLFASALLCLSAVLAVALLSSGLGARFCRWTAVAGALVIAALSLSVLSWSSSSLVTLLLGAAGWLKLAERRQARDRIVAAIAGLWLVATGLLTLPSNVALLTVALTVASLVWCLCNEIPQRRWAFSATVGPALILTALLFVFTPRITGNLGMLAFVLNLPFVIETEAEAARKPQKGEMALEEFQDTQSDQLRVLVADFSLGSGPFEKTAPPVNELYWRGPVFWQYEDTKWSARPGFDRRSTRLKTKLTGDKLDAQIKEATRVSLYDVTVFPHRGEWLYSLDIPGFTPPSSYITQDWQLMNLNPIRELLTYNMMSFVEYRAGLEPDEETRTLGLQLPEGEEPRTVALGRALREKYGPDPVEIARHARDLFSSGYSYDRSAPVIEGENPIDSFMFDTREGYGMHFATAYALMMRSAGVPSRVVSGYHGGLYMFLIERVFVTQRDSHAWAEIWLDDYGWVRMDVARATLDAQSSASNIGSMMAASQGDQIAPADEGNQSASGASAEETEGNDHPDDADAHWLSKFDAQMQGQLLEATGLRAQAGTLLLAGAIVTAVLALLFVAGRLLVRFVRWRRMPPAQRLATRFCRVLADSGHTRKPSEGLRSYTARVLASDAANPQDAARIFRAVDWLCRALYGADAGPIPPEIAEICGRKTGLRQLAQNN